MPDLMFHVEHCVPDAAALTPLLLFKLHVQRTDSADPVHSIHLRCQIRIEPGRRIYSDAQRAALFELFGRPAQWTQSLRPMLWQHVTAIVPSFERAVTCDLPVPCLFDFDLAATKYFSALGPDGDIPLCLLFSGTVFYDTAGTLRASPIPWDKEATCRLPARVWHEMMNRHHPDAAFLRLPRATFDRLRAYKTAAGHATLEEAVDRLLHHVAPAATEVPS